MAKHNKQLLDLDLQIHQLQQELNSEEQLLEEILREEQYELSERDLYSFVLNGFKHIDPSQLKNNWYIGAICEFLDAIYRRQIRNLIINIPPRHLKTTCCSVLFNGWVWLQDPSHKFMAASAGMSLSLRASVAARRLVECDWYKKRWGDRFHLTSDQNTKSMFENSCGGYRFTTSIGSSVIGQGADIQILDDPHDAAEVQSKIKRDFVIDWYENAWTTRKNDPATGCEVLVMQRLHEEDLSGYLIAKGTHTVLRLPMEYEPQLFISNPLGWIDPRTKVGELLSPDRYSDEQIEALKRNAYKWAGQFQQLPAPKEGSIVKRKDIEFYTPNSMPSTFDVVLASWDLSFGGDSESAYVVGSVWGKCGAKKYLLDVVRKQMDFPQQIRAIQELNAKYPDIRVTLIEDKANGRAAIDTLSSYVPGVIPINPREFGGDKESRLQACTPDFEAHNVFFPVASTVTWDVQYCINELTTFPRSKYADFVDSTTQALNYMFKYNKSTVAYVMAPTKPVENSRDYFSGGNVNVYINNVNVVRGLFS